jgi:hypothetical protein
MKTRGVKFDFKELNACIPVCSFQKANTRKTLKRDVLPGQYDVERLITKRKKSGVSLTFCVRVGPGEGGCKLQVNINKNNNNDNEKQQTNNVCVCLFTSTDFR